MEFSGEEAISLLELARLLLAFLLDEGVESELGKLVFSGPSLLEFP